MWSLGCMVAGMIYKRDPFFHGKDNDDQLVKIAKVLGTDALHAYLDKYGLKLPPRFDDLLSQFPKKPWNKFITAECEPLVSKEAMDFIDGLLRYDHQGK